MNSRTIRPFWALYRALPALAGREADKAFELCQQDPFYPSLQFKYEAVYPTAPDEATV